jgi:drug/metabolite transporter (DMT)-like permease
MPWAVLTIVFAGSYGVTNVVEKVLLTRYLPDSATLIAWFGIAQIAFIIPFAILFPLENGTPFLSIASLVGSGVLYGLAFSILLYVIRTAEVSRAFPIFNTSPVFVALFSVMVLGQHLDVVKWGAIVLTLLGAVLITVELRGGGRFRFDRSFWMLMLAALLVAGDFLTASHGLKDIDPFQALWLQRIGAFLPLAIWWNRDTLGNVRASMRSPVTMALILGSEFALSAAAQLALLGALERGPVSLVSAIGATPPVWIFVIGTAVSTRFLPILSETIDRRTLSLKAVAIAMTVVGTIGVVL